jgi:MFS family permease
VVLVLAFCNILASIGLTRFAYTLIMPAMRDGLALPYAAMGTIGTVGFILYMVVGPPAGAVAARLGMRTTMSGALVLAALGLFGLAVAPGLWSALIANAVAQVGAAAANVAGFAVVVPWFPPHRRGLAMGVSIGGAGAGILLVGLLLPPIIATGPSGWRAAWAAAGTLTVLTAVGIAVFLRDHSDASWSRFRTRAGVAGAWRELLSTRGLWIAAIVGGLFGFEYIVIGTFFAVHLTMAGHAIEDAGQLWSLVGGLMIWSGLIGGALSDRIGRLPAQAALFVAQAAAALGLVVFTAGPGLYVAIALFGGTAMGTTAVAMTFTTELVGPARASSAIGFTNVMFGAGQALGPLVAGLLVDATGSVSVALLSSATASLLGAAVSLLAARRLRA